MANLDAVQIALIQMYVKAGLENKEENVKRACELIDLAVAGYPWTGDGHLDIIGLPETWNTYYPMIWPDDLEKTMEVWRKWAEPIPDSPTLEKISEKAAEHGVYIQAGSILEIDENQNVYNTATLFDRKGRLVGKYRKVQTWIPEPATSGNEFPVFDTDLGKIGMMICYDGNFPEIARALAFNGAELIFRFAYYNDPVICEGLDWWKITNQARALENQCYIAACTGVGFDPWYSIAGHSMIVDPYGRILVATADANNSERIIGATIDINEVRRIRREWKIWNHLRHIRPEVYAEVYKKEAEKRAQCKM